MKHLRNKTGGQAKKIKSFLIKVVVMKRILIKPEQYWNNKNLDHCFIDCLSSLKDGLKQKSITDIFYPQVIEIAIWKLKTYMKKSFSWILWRDLMIQSLITMWGGWKIFLKSTTAPVMSRPCLEWTSKYNFNFNLFKSIFWSQGIHWRNHKSQTSSNIENQNGWNSWEPL